MSFVVIHTDPHHTDFSHERAELDAIGATLRPLNVTTEEEVAAAARSAVIGAGGDRKQFSHW